MPRRRLKLWEQIAHLTGSQSRANRKDNKVSIAAVAARRRVARLRTKRNAVPFV